VCSVSEEDKVSGTNQSDFFFPTGSIMTSGWISEVIRNEIFK
jgi:hypothetical protein